MGCRESNQNKYLYILDLSSALLSQGKGASFVPSPATGVLSPFSEEIIEISAYSDIWGVYTDNLICWVSTYIHTRCSALVYVCEIYF